MSALMRLFALALAGAALALAWRAPSVVWGDLYVLLVAEAALRDALDARLEAVQRCEAGKEEVIGDLIAGG